MTAAAKKNPEQLGGCAGSSDYKKLRRNITTPPSALDILREAQILAAGLVALADRIDAAGCKLLALAGGVR